MADLTDVETSIVNIVGGAIYPNGSGQPSVLPGNAVAKIGRGWPLPASLDADLAAGNLEITVYPLSGSYSKTYQILNQTYLITAPAITTSVAVAGDVITVSGTLSAGEFLTLIIDGATVCSQTGANVQAMLSALAAQAVTAGYAATSTATTITVSFGHSLTVRQGGEATMGRVTHRQCHSIMVSVWAPNDSLRTAAAILADVELKKNIKLTMPDTSQCLLRYVRTMSSDQQEKAMIYRRDLVYEAEYATLEQFPGTTITSADISIAKPDNTAIATAIE